jgi:hypothetical protein
MYEFFHENSEEFYRHYHRRSNIETTFAMIKAKFWWFRAVQESQRTSERGPSKGTLSQPMLPREHVLRIGYYTGILAQRKICAG